MPENPGSEPKNGFRDFFAEVEPLRIGHKLQTQGSARIQPVKIDPQAGCVSVI